MRRNHATAFVVLLGVLMLSAISASAALASGKPFVETKPATSVGQTEAVLNGVVNPNGAETKYYFEYGTTISYGKKTAEAAAGSGTANVEESKTISGLTKSTTYHFRVVATNSNGTSDGTDQALTTTGEGAKCPGTIENGGVALCSEGHALQGTFALTIQRKAGVIHRDLYPKEGSTPPEWACQAQPPITGNFVAASSSVELTSFKIYDKECKFDGSNAELAEDCEIPGETITVDGGEGTGKGPGLHANLTTNGDLALRGGTGEDWTKFNIKSVLGKTCLDSKVGVTVSGSTSCSLRSSTTEAVTHVLACEEKANSQGYPDLSGYNGEKTYFTFYAEVKLASGKEWSLQNI